MNRLDIEAGQGDNGVGFSFCCRATVSRSPASRLKLNRLLWHVNISALVPSVKSQARAKPCGYVFMSAAQTDKSAVFSISSGINLTSFL